MNVLAARRDARISLRRCVHGRSGGRQPRWAATPDDCHALRKHGHRAEAQKCYESLTAARDPYLRAEGTGAWRMYQEANNQFRIAVAQSPAMPCTASAGAA